MADSLTVTLEVGSETEEIELPADIVDLYREEANESDAQVIADMLVMAFSERAHAIAHHGEGGDEETIQRIEDDMMAIFEDRFGMTYAEATGHSH